MFNAEGRIQAGRIEIELFHIIDPTEARPGCEIVFEGFDLRSRPFGNCFDATVRQVLHVPDDLVPRRRSLCEKAITNALNVAPDEEAASDLSRICRRLELH